MAASKRRPVTPKRQKSAKKTAKPAKIPQPNGRGALYAGGVPGNKGGTGRPPNEFKEFMRSLADSEDAKKGLKALLKTRGKLFLGAVKHVTEHGYGKPVQDLTSGGKAFVPTAIAVRLVDAGNS